MNGAKIDIWAMIVKRFFALFLIEPLYRHFTPMQIYCRAKLILGDQITNPAVDRHAFDKLASTSSASASRRLSSIG
ncbi:hypothetical protein KJ068_09545 [bacterium]|nr:hypothetical protein [bacterium]